MISHQYLNPQKTTHPPSGGVGHIVAVFQIVAALAGNQGFAEATGFQGGQIVLGAICLLYTSASWSGLKVLFSTFM